LERIDRAGAVGWGRAFASFCAKSMKIVTIVDEDKCPGAVMHSLEAELETELTLTKLTLKGDQKILTFES